jgi:hypothetical protein
MLSTLPDELQLQVLICVAAHPASLVALAGCCRAVARLTDDAAASACAAQGVLQKGMWCGTRSWRVQLCGRSFRSGMRVLRQIGSAGTRSGRAATRSARSAAPTPMFGEPAAVAALGSGLLAVCDTRRRCISIVDARGSEAQTLRTIPIDGVPCGACRALPATPALAVGAFAPVVPPVVASVQGVAESGAPIEGVVNRSHRLERHDVSGGDGAGGGGDGGGNGAGGGGDRGGDGGGDGEDDVGSKSWWGSGRGLGAQHLSFPTGVAWLRPAGGPSILAVAECAEAIRAPEPHSACVQGSPFEPASLQLEQQQSGFGARAGQLASARLAQNG